MSERVAYTVPEVAEATGLHPDTVRAAIQRGEIPATRVGRQWLVPAAWLAEVAR
jgi:excisionase family DNA binding protein